MRVAIGVACFLLASCGGATRGDLPPGDTEIKRAAGLCRRPHYCGAIGYVDCGAATDLPAYFFERSTGHIIAACGGACMYDPDNSCKKQCPPRGWTCGHIPDEPLTGPKH